VERNHLRYLFAGQWKRISLITRIGSLLSLFCKIKFCRIPASYPHQFILQLFSPRESTSKNGNAGAFQSISHFDATYLAASLPAIRPLPMAYIMLVPQIS
jgi:hypothetical protein